MNGAEILEKYKQSVIDGDDSIATLPEMIDNALADNQYRNYVVIKQKLDAIHSLQQQLESLTLQNKVLATQAPIIDLEKQILEREAVIARITSDLAGFVGYRYALEPSEALRQHDEQIKKEAQEKCASLCVRLVDYGCADICVEEIRRLKL